MVENKKKNANNLNSFDKKKLVEPNFRSGEKKVYIPEKKRELENFQKIQIL